MAHIARMARFPHGGRPQPCLAFHRTAPQALRDTLSGLKGQPHNALQVLRRNPAFREVIS
jgi:hypothetical protein